MIKTDTDEALATAGLYRLLAWLSPGFPIGAFTYSHGLEKAAESGAVRDRAALQHWIAAVVEMGVGRMDADIIRDAHRAAVADDIDALLAANRRGVPRKHQWRAGPKERLFLPPAALAGPSPLSTAGPRFLMKGTNPFVTPPLSAWLWHAPASLSQSP